MNDEPVTVTHTTTKSVSIHLEISMRASGLSLASRYPHVVADVTCPPDEHEAVAAVVGAMAERLIAQVAASMPSMRPMGVADKPPESK